MEPHRGGLASDTLCMDLRQRLEHQGRFVERTCHPPFFDGPGSRRTDDQAATALGEPRSNSGLIRRAIAVIFQFFYDYAKNADHSGARTRL